VHFGTLARVPAINRGLAVPRERRARRHCGTVGPAQGRGTGRSSFRPDSPRVTVVLRGRCACNAVAFEVSDEFVVAYNCHCSNCRAATGSAFLPWGEIEPEKLRVTKGAGSLLVEGDPDASHAVRCGECFSRLYWTGLRRQDPRAVWLIDRRASAQANGAHVRRLEGFVARNLGRPPSARRVPLVLIG
jgi:hypothetical protein